MPKVIEPKLILHGLRAQVSEERGEMEKMRLVKKDKALRVEFGKRKVIFNISSFVRKYREEY